MKTKTVRSMTQKEQLDRFDSNTSPTGSTETTARQVKSGEFVRFRDTDTAPVWVRGGFDRASKTFAFSKADDMNHEAFVKGSRKCFVGFTY